MTPWARALLRGALRVVAAAFVVSVAACTSQMSALQGERSVVQWISPAAQGAESVEVPAIFTLKNATMGPIALQSLRVPVGVEVSTAPPLPTTLKSGERIEVVVLAKFRRDQPEATRRILLEAANQPPLELTVQGRMRPEASAPPPTLVPAQ